MTLDLQNFLFDQYGMSLTSPPRQDQRGMMNETWFVSGDYVLTIFKNRPPLAVALIAAVVQVDESELLPKIVTGKEGPVTMPDGRAAILWQRLSGNHYVGRDHSNKIPIPKTGHEDIAECFWKLHASLDKSRKIGPWLGKMNYIAPAAQGMPDLAFGELPPNLQKDYIAEYMQTSTLPLYYPSFVHRDFERQNVLNAPDGTITGVVDSDALMMGDLLFEYAHCMMNFVFSDPQYHPGNADIYMKAMERAGVISENDKVLLPVLIRAFAAKDLLDYHRYDYPAKTDLSRLASIYDISLEQADRYFASASQPVPKRPKNKMRQRKPAEPQDGV